MKRITITLLLALLSITGAPPAFAQGTTPGKGTNMPVFSDIDLNGDGAIVATEFYQARSKRMAERAAKGGKLKNAANAPSFEDIDTDDNDKVTPDEFSAHQAEQMARHRSQKKN